MIPFLLAPLLLAAQPFEGPPIQAPPPPERIRSPDHVTPAVAARPIDPNNWITGDDYPTAALRVEAEGVVVVTYLVGPDGLPSDCRIERSSGVLALDVGTCSVLMARARFVPARDAAGRPADDVRTQRVVWTLPPEDGRTRFVSGFAGVAVPVTSHDNTCASTASRRGLRPLALDLCAELPDALSTTGLPVATSALPPFLGLIVVERSGEALGREPRTFGILNYVEEADFEVAPDGTVLNCRRRVVAAWTERPEFDLCRFLATTDGPFFARERAATAPRAGRMSVRFYRNYFGGDVLEL